MLKFFKAIFANPRQRRDRRIERIIDLALDKTVDGTDSRLRVARAYRKRLRDSIEVAVMYVHETVEAMPPPIEMSRRTFAADPQAHAFFGSATDLQRAVSLDPTVRAFLAGPASYTGEYLYLGLATTMVKKKMFAPVLKGNAIQHDVARTVVNFTEPRLFTPTDSEETLRWQIKERVFTTLVECALARLAGIRDHKKELEKHRILLRAKLKTMKKHALGLEPLTQSKPDRVPNRAGLESTLVEIEAALSKTGASIKTLDDTLDLVNGVMAEPETHVKIVNSSIRLTRMNFVAKLEDDEPSAEIVYTDFETSDARKVAGRLITFPRSELLNVDALRKKMRSALGVY